MHNTNVSTHENPPHEAEYSTLSHLNSRQDYLDVFVVTMLRRSPVIYVLINITLLIWLAQTIITSKVNQIPRSAYLISPFFGMEAISDISVSKSDVCPPDWEKIMLKTFPTVFEESYTHKKMYQWGESGEMVFCAKRLKRGHSLYNYNGSCPKVQCSDYCVDTKRQCPITMINRRYSYEKIKEEQTVFYTSSDSKFKYVYTKREGRAVVSLIATFHSRCANDFRYLDEFKKVEDYYKTVFNCGPEGTINSFYDKFDQISSKKFFFYNNRGFGPQQENLQTIELGSVHEIDFDNDFYGECSTVRETAKSASSYLFKDPAEPLFTQSLLVVSFILMVAQIIWVIVNFCVGGYFREKNLIAILICIIELTVISFIYSENTKLFDTQKVIRKIADCIETQVTAAATWNFGIQSSSAFSMIQFIATIFLATFLFSFIVDKLVFTTSTQLYRNFQYESDPQNPPQLHQGRMSEQS